LPLILALTFASELCAAGEPDLRTALTHPLRYYVVEPERCQPPGERLPVLVCVAGADADFVGTARRFAEARGEVPILLVVPCTVSNTNTLRGVVRQRYADLYREDTVAAVAGETVRVDVRARLA
jgi:hypothetical protein